MAEIFKFFNSAPGDERWYFASDFADYFGNVLSSGLLHKDGTPNLQVKVVEGELKTRVDVGEALMQGYQYENTLPLTLEHGLPEPNLDRIDRIVLRLDKRNDARYIKLFVKQGESAVNPSPPQLQRDNYVHELSLAQVRVRKNTSSLNVADVKDERMIEDLCGIVYSLISVPTTVFQQQFDTWLADYKINNTTAWEAWQNQEKADFEAWFDSVKDILDGDVATKLAAQIATVDDMLNQHIAQDNAHGIGDKTTLATPGKTTIVGAINSHVVDYIKHPGYAVTTGKNAYNVTLNPKPSTLSEGFGIVIKVGANATDNCTLNVNGMGAKAIMSSDNRQITDLSAGVVYTLRYNGTSFILQGRGGEPVRLRDKIITMPGLVDLERQESGAGFALNPASSETTYYFYDLFDRGATSLGVSTRDKKTLKIIARGDGNILSPFDAVYAPVFGDNVVMCAGVYNDYRQLHLVDAALRVVKIIDTLPDGQSYTYVSKADGLLYASVYNRYNKDKWTNVYDQNGTVIKKLINKEGHVTIYDGAPWLISYYNDRCRVTAVNTNDYRDFARNTQYRNNAVMRDGIFYFDLGVSNVPLKAYDMTTEQNVATGVRGAVIGLKSIYGSITFPNLTGGGLGRFKLGSLVKVTPDDEMVSLTLCRSYLHRPFGSNTEFLLPRNTVTQLGIDTGVTE